MKKIMGRLVAAGVVMSALCVAAGTNEVTTADQKPEEMKEEESKAWSVEVSVDVLSDYVWRGKICSDTPVWQPSVTLGYDFGEDFGAVSVNAWASLYATHKGKPRSGMGTHEIDYTLAYTKSFGPVSFEVGHLWYTFPNQRMIDGERAASSTAELYAGVSYENDILTPSFTAYWDYSDTGWNDPSAVYMAAAVEHEFNLFDLFTLTPSAGLGFGDGAYMSSYADGVNKPEFADVNVGLSAGYQITDNISVGASLKYCWIMSHTLRAADYMGNGKDQLLYGGVNVTFAF